MEEPAALSIRRIIRVPVLHEDHELPAQCGSGNAHHAFDWSTSPLPFTIVAGWFIFACPYLLSLDRSDPQL